MSLLDAQINTSAYYTMRVLKIDPKTRRFMYHYEPYRHLSNWDALQWSAKFANADQAVLYQWDGAAWRQVPGFGGT